MDAVNAGIITAAFTGFDRNLGKCKKYTKAWREGKSGSDEKDKAFVKLYAYLEKLEGIAKGIMGRCEHPGMKNYMKTVGYGIAQRRE